MCVAMVIIYKKTLEKKGADDVTSTRTDLSPAQTMSQGAALFSFGLMETRRWHEVGHSCAIQQSPVGTSLESLWDVLPEVHKGSAHWDWDVGSTSSTISSLLQDLSLTEAAAAASHSKAPPSKRQCRSLSCSDELSSCRSTWRPQGSRVWTAVEKRRCLSGGSVQRGGGGNGQLGFPAMQRSSSFSLPARSDPPEPPGSAQRPPWPSAFAGLTSASSMPLPGEPAAQPLYLSHEQICLAEPPAPSPPSSPDSTPELERRGGQGGLARCRSQPCVLNDKKIGVKRRRPADSQKQRPSLDLAKMTQPRLNRRAAVTGQADATRASNGDEVSVEKTASGQATNNVFTERCQGALRVSGGPFLPLMYCSVFFFEEGHWLSAEDFLTPLHLLIIKKPEVLLGASDLEKLVKLEIRTDWISLARKAPHSSSPSCQERNRPQQWCHMCVRPKKFLDFPDKLRNFHSLSCPGITGEDVGESSQDRSTLRATTPIGTDHSAARQHSLEDVQPRPSEADLPRQASSAAAAEEAEWNYAGDLTPPLTGGKDGEPLWVGLCSMRRDVYQLGGELDIEQIERN
ncbi:unnamed protein product [Menidia menidia]|uniref:(Atlantic silverside) hypothetical protein n=1 Tax=Menidia menidia TaxID=238744 RepID=A0A8S4AV26_9TELE|nr:unnamed protein product [Menidia menidia]